MNFITASNINDKYSNPFNQRNNNDNNNNNNGPPRIEYKKAKQRELVIVIDTHEGRNNDMIDKIAQRLIKLCYDPETVIKRQALNLFDFQFVFKNDPTRNFGPLIERKSATDLVDSIKGSRWTEQKERMKSLTDVPATNKIYIFEGNLLAKYYGIDPKALLNACLLPPMRMEAEIQLTQNFEATADIIVAWFVYLEHLENEKLISSFSYARSIQGEVKKKDFVDKNKLPIILSQMVYGVTGTAADAISAKFKNSLSELQIAYFKNPSKTIEDIASVTYMVKGHETKVGVAASENVIKACECEEMRNFMKTLGKECNDDDDDDDNDNMSITSRIKKAKNKVAADSRKKNKASLSLRPLPISKNKRSSNKAAKVKGKGKTKEDTDDDDIEDDEDEHNHNNANNNNNNNNNTDFDDGFDDIDDNILADLKY